MRGLPTLRFNAQLTVARARVSVVIPCFNYGRYLADAVRSVLTQEGVDVDVIIVDDASKDDSLDVAYALAESDRRVSVMANPTNSGAVLTFNLGLAAAGGEFLVRLDADDMLTPGSLARAVAVMRAFPEVGLVYGRPIHFSGDMLPAFRSRNPRWLVWKGPDWLATRCADGTNVITSPEAMMRRAVVDVVGGQRQLAHTHDMEMWLRIAAHADVAYIRGVDQAWHREHPGSLSSHAENPIVILADIRDAFEVLFEYLGPNYPEIGELRRSARAAVARQAWEQARRTLDRGQKTPEAEALVAFARECAPSSAERFRIVTSPAPCVSIVRRSWGVVARARRRSREMIRKFRWRRTGVYEPLLVGRSGSRGLSER